jgi:hypothetical protein
MTASGVAHPGQQGHPAKHCADQRDAFDALAGEAQQLRLERRLVAAPDAVDEAAEVAFLGSGADRADRLLVELARPVGSRVEIVRELRQLLAEDRTIAAAGLDETTRGVGSHDQADGAAHFGGKALRVLALGCVAREGEGVRAGQRELHELRRRLERTGDEDDRIGSGWNLEQGFDRRDAFVSCGIDQDVARASEQGDRGRFVSKAGRIPPQLAAGEVDALGFAPQSRPEQPRERARSAVVGAVEQEEALVAGIAEGAFDLRAARLHCAGPPWLRA